MQSTATVNGQVTIPKLVREHLTIAPGDRIRFFTAPDGGVTILPVLPISPLPGILKGRRNTVLTVEEMDSAVAEAIAGEYLESSQG